MSGIVRTCEERRESVSPPRDFMLSRKRLYRESMKSRGGLTDSLLSSQVLTIPDNCLQLEQLSCNSVCLIVFSSVSFCICVVTIKF